MCVNRTTGTLLEAREAKAKASTVFGRLCPTMNSSLCSNTWRHCTNRVVFHQDTKIPDVPATTTSTKLAASRAKAARLHLEAIQVVLVTTDLSLLIKLTIILSTMSLTTWTRFGTEMHLMNTI